MGKKYVFLLTIFVIVFHTSQANDTSLLKYLDSSSINPKKNNPELKLDDLSNQISKITNADLYAAIERYNKEKFMKSPEFILGIMLLSFAFTICILQVYLFTKGKLTSSQISRLMLITLIIFSVLFLIVSGYSNDQIAPAVGLLGTIAGYLLGRNSTTTNTGTTNNKV